MNVEQILKLRTLNELKRFNIRITLHPENVSSHSLFTAIIARCIAFDYNQRVGEDRKFDLNSIYLYTSLHDIDESELGDVLMPTKIETGIGELYKKLEEDVKFRIHSNLNVETYSLTKKDSLLIKFADRIEGYMYCIEEIVLGNGHFVSISQYYRKDLIKLIDSCDDVELKELFKEVLNEVDVETPRVSR